METATDTIGADLPLDGVLTASLDVLQLELLKLVWDPIVRAEMWDITPDWPVWDYVSRELHRQHPNLEDAVSVLDSLPRLSLPIPYRDHPYGLIWRSSPPSIRPGPEEVIGLSIAGFAALAAHQVMNRHIPDQLALMVAQLANWETGLKAKPNEVAKQDVALAMFTSWFTTTTIERPFVVSDRAIAAVLQREYAPTIVFPYNEDTGHQVQLGRISLRRYRKVTTAAAYLEQVAEADALRTPPDRYVSPLTLVQTFDYLAYVLADDPQWPKGPRLTSAPNLQSAAAVSATVTGQHDFETAMSGLCTVIDQLVVPPVPADELAKLANDQARAEAQGTINRLERWLARRLGDTDGFARAKLAVGVLRDVRAVRVEAQHRSSPTQNQAIKARRRLGLPDIVSDWPGAWFDIQSQLAGALDVIRQEIQAAP